jgi:hypothetical protein
MVKQGYAQLAKLAIETSSKIADAVIDRNISKVYDENIKPQERGWVTSGYPDRLVWIWKKTKKVSSARSVILPLNLMMYFM